MIFILRGTLTDRADVLLDNPFPEEVYPALQPVLKEQPSKEFDFWWGVAAPYELVTWRFHSRAGRRSVNQSTVQVAILLLKHA
jgi:hypothetical protein